MWPSHRTRVCSHDSHRWSAHSQGGAGVLSSWLCAASHYLLQQQRYCPVIHNNPDSLQSSNVISFLTVSVGARCQVLRKWLGNCSLCPGVITQTQSLRNALSGSKSHTGPSLRAKYLPRQAFWADAGGPFMSILGPGIVCGDDISCYLMVRLTMMMMVQLSVYQSWVFGPTHVSTSGTRPTHMSSQAPIYKFQLIKSVKLFI